MCTQNTSWSMFKPEIRAASAAASLTLATLGTIGNALSIGLICSGGLQRSAPTMALILGMCTANLMSTSLLLPVVGTSNLHGIWLLGDGLCKAYGYIVYVTLTAEYLQLLALTLTQYLTVVHRVTSDKLRRHLPELVGVPWVAACLIYLVPLTGLWETFGYDQRRGYCTLVSAKGLGGGGGGTFVALLSALFGALMTLVNVYCYSAILYVTHQSRRRITSSIMEAAARFKGRTRDLQLLRMTAIIFANFGLTYLPFLVLLAMDPCLEQISPIFFTVILYVSWSHAATNSVIYALMNTRINRLWVEFCCSAGFSFGKIVPDQLALRSFKIKADVASGRVSRAFSDEGVRHTVCIKNTECTGSPWLDIPEVAEESRNNEPGCCEGPSVIVIVKAVIPRTYTQAAAISREDFQLQAQPNTVMESKPTRLSESEI
ncbi:hypothetical protein RRG08_049652 [Elysia crispata]|uniref:G-protein coupled receptors family 1 profile domain-containing protein n=1 Tax=Elysia crispata TaxID=231223 RepID=A0AAE0Y744_9GAST|nr:hypothetical protein RRG08_049652 [Elysia crispata]